ncbi:MAG TPA: cupredoxin domain-containing protein [Dehalococcoidia bacterium]|nr:cupredoxin domain-containing protein [Dehalococcoidia bacterium]
MTQTSFKRVWWLLLSAIAIPLLTLSFACGGDDDDDDDDDGSPATSAPANGDDDDDGNGGEVSFDVSMGDNFFEPNEFTVPAGATVTFNLTNDGAAIHNMRIFGADNEQNTDDDVVSDPDLVTGGETATLEWTAPEETGEYDFLCDFHPTDMIGVITVE